MAAVKNVKGKQLFYVHGSLIYKTTTLHVSEVSEKNQIQADIAVYIIFFNDDAWCLNRLSVVLHSWKTAPNMMCHVYVL